MNTYLKQFNHHLQLKTKQVMKKESFESIAYKIIPYDFINEINPNRVYSSTTAKGIEISNSNFDGYWNPLKKFWPELFNKTLFEY